MQDLPTIEAQLTRILGFFPRVEGKVGGLFAVDSALLAVVATNVQAGDLKLWYVGVPGALVLLGLVASYTFLYRANFPDLQGGAGSLIYFTEIQARTESVFMQEIEAIAEADYRADLLRQVWRNSVILCAKYRALALATRLTLATLLPFTAFLVATSIEHSRVPLIKG